MTATTVSSNMTWKLFRKAMALATEIGLTNDERHELAQIIPTTDADFDASWKSLNEDQLQELVAMLCGYIYIRYLGLMRPPGGNDDDLMN